MKNETQFTDLEKGKLFALCQDKAMVAALKKVLLADLIDAGVTTKDHDAMTNWAYNMVYQSINGQMVDNKRSNEELGENLRGMTMGITLLNTAFARLETFNVTEAAKVPETNPAV